MNYKEYLEALAQQTDMTVEQAGVLAASVADAIGQELQEGHDVRMEGFGSFVVDKELEHITRNPVTGQRMRVPPRLVVRFHPDGGLADGSSKHLSEHE